VLPGIAVALASARSQFRIGILGQINFLHEIRQAHRALRVERSRVDGGKNFLREWFNAGFGPILTAKRDGQFFANHFSLDRTVGLHYIVAVTHEPRSAPVKKIPSLLSHKIPFENSALHANMYGMAFLEGDQGEMERQVAWATGKAGAEDVLLSAASDTEAYYGRNGKARDLSRGAIDSAKRNDQKESAALWQMEAALREAELGNSAPARQQVTQPTQ
jgi:hypothetical protein